MSLLEGPRAGGEGGAIVRRLALASRLSSLAKGYTMTTVVVFGGSGFLGRRLVWRLAGDELNVRVAVHVGIDLVDDVD
jgi:hypothetical protein